MTRQTTSGRARRAARVTRRVVLSLLLVVASAERASAQAPQRLETSVTAVAGNSVYLDKGREDGVEPDDEVVIYPTGSVEIPGVVVATSKSSCRVEHNQVFADIPIGSRATVLLPAERARASTAQDTYGPATAGELPWSHPPEEWDENTPLLAPALGRRREERETVWRHRLTTQLRHVRDSEFDVSYTTGVVDFDSQAENPFHGGGTLHLSGSYLLQAASLSDASDDSDTYLRLRRLSYERGGTREAPHFYEVGRFLHNEFPELGVVDGAEWIYRLPSGSRIGASAGALPEPFPAFDSGDDLGVSAFYRHVSGEDEDLSLGLALQNTWHEGEQDRTLLVGTADWAPNRKTSFHAAAWVDHYDSDDQLKSSGLELTELRGHARYRPSNDSGFGVNVARIRWPQLLRNEFATVSPQLVSDGRVDRLGVDGYKRFGKHVRLSASVNRWSDQDDSGLAWRARSAWRDLLYERGEVGLEVFNTQGRATDGPGLRLFASGRLDRRSWTLGYSYVDWDADGNPLGSFEQHTLSGTYDWVLRGGSVLSVQSDKRFGDAQDSLGLGIRYTIRF